MVQNKSNRNLTTSLQDYSQGKITHVTTRQPVRLHVSLWDNAQVKKTRFTATQQLLSKQRFSLLFNTTVTSLLHTTITLCYSTTLSRLLCVNTGVFHSLLTCKHRCDSAARKKQTSRFVIQVASGVPAEVSPETTLPCQQFHLGATYTTPFSYWIENKIMWLSNNIANIKLQKLNKITIQFK